MSDTENTSAWLVRGSVEALPDRQSMSEQYRQVVDRMAALVMGFEPGHAETYRRLVETGHMLGLL